MTEFLVVVVVVIVAVKGTLHFVKWLSNMTKETGDSIKLRCEAVGDPTPTRIRWYKNDAPVLEEKGRVVVRKYHTAGQVLSFFLCNFFIFFFIFFFTFSFHLVSLPALAFRSQRVHIESI